MPRLAAWRVGMPTCASSIYALYRDALRLADDVSFRLLSSSSLCVSTSRAVLHLSSSVATPHATTRLGGSLPLLGGSDSITTSLLTVGSLCLAEAGLAGEDDGALVFEGHLGGSVAGRGLDSLTPERKA